MVRSTRVIIFAPNWLGDAVMALPAIADVRRALPNASIAVAARPPVAPLFRLVTGVDEVIVMDRSRWCVRTAGIAGARFGTALLLPNSLKVAVVARQAGIAERWGYRTDCRGPLLTRAVDPPSRVVHQVDYYRHLVKALGFPNGDAHPRLTVPDDVRVAADGLLRSLGWDGRIPLAAIAPGAAYGGAKRWPPERFAALAEALASDGVEVVMIGSDADRETASTVARLFQGRDAGGLKRVALHNLVGATDLPTLAGVLALSRALVTNDSGAMHLAAAVGTPVTAVFGPTNEHATRPVGDAHAVVAGAAWCRPCMLRECPIDHRCMRSIEVEAVLSAARRSL